VGRPRLRVFLLTIAIAILGTIPASAAFARISLAGPGGWVAGKRLQPATHLIVHVRSGPIPLYNRPFQRRPVARLGSRTPFGSPRALAVFTRRGRWLGVTDAELPNGRLGWIDGGTGGIAYSRTPLEVEVDLSSRTLLLRRDGVVIHSATVGVGRPDSPTPTGRFAVTDKLDGHAYSSYYGCCILALSATQPNLPAGWSGGDRIAIHGTPSAGDFGHAVSAGCIHARDDDLRYLMRRVPLGTPVVIRR
jgi:hypothetical protein